MFKSWLKKYFIPHEENDHRPCFWHGDNIKKVTVFLLLVELVVFVIPTVFISREDFASAVLPGALARLANAERTDRSLNPLRSNSLLDLAAQKKAEDMARKSYFAHTSPEGRTPWSWLTEVGYRYVVAGENLAVNFRDSEDVTDAWMNSPSHRDNILRAGYTEVGTGIAKGMYKGRQAIFVTQYYATPGSAFLPSVLTAEYLESSLLGEMFSSPHNTTNLIFMILLSLVVIALLINFFVKIEVQHRDLLANGLFMIVLLFGLLVINNAVAKGDINPSSTGLASFEVIE